MIKYGYVYLIGSSRFGWYKIGKSKTPNMRVKQLGILLPFKVEVFAIWKSDNHSLLETLFHEKYLGNAINGEWFSFNRKQAEKIILEYPPYNAERVFPTAATIGSNFSTFSNLKEDVYRDVVKKQRIQGGVVFIEAVMDYMKDNGMEDTKENKKIARKAVGKLWSDHRKLISIPIVDNQ